ncbi:aminotransferase A [Halobacillus mangrovi]|uniref:Aminotransferase n=1 Tax=Halobacillus mangrovi TaxID=402384 RepID=A0A1W5ZWQ0_9BACI|nr:aminotransferase A [Halobacillus mangrovi]ARI77671.1 aromatic amino acid aminotransferase [Halobacillus mangrovi]
MEQLINQNVKDIQISGIRQFFNMVGQYEDVVSLTIGQPDFYTPDHIKKAAIHAIQNNHTSYTHNAGVLPLRKAIQNHVQEAYHMSYHAETEIIVTVGASQAIDVSLRTLLAPGDEVILPGPVYPGYEPLIRLAGATPVHVDTRGNQFKMTSELIEEKITPKTKAVILPYPSNPTGVSLTESELNDIASVIKQHQLFVIADEIYSELVYEKSHVSIGTFSTIRDQVIIINGVSKSHAMTGWRIGYILAPAWLSKHMLKVHQYNVSCASSISQYAALEALTNGKEDPSRMKTAYMERKKYVEDRLTQMGIEYTSPDGAFYIFPKLQIEGKTTFALALQLVKEAGLALVPGDAFSQYGEGYLRLSYAYSLETLEEGLYRLENFLNKNSV